jgi:UTP--glucose-1-phosphate uridylyltransferase
MSYKAPTKAVITDAGFASRFLPITKTIPKAMIPIGAKPVMQFFVEQCAAAGIEHIVIVATPHSMGRAIYEDYFQNPADNVKQLLTKQGKAERFEPVEAVLNLPKVTVIEQDPDLPYGNGTPVLAARPYLELADDEPFLAMFSDDLVLGASDVELILQTHAAQPDAKAIVMAQEMPESVLDKYGVVKFRDAEARTLDYIVEKPAAGTAPSNLAFYGATLLTPEIFTHLDPANTGKDNELWLTDAITKIAADHKVLVEKTAGQWLTTGDPKNYFLACLRYALDNEDYADEIRQMVK